MYVKDVHFHNPSLTRFRSLELAAVRNIAREILLCKYRLFSDGQLMELCKLDIFCMFYKQQQLFAYVEEMELTWK